MGDELAILFDRIRLLLDGGAGNDADRIEHTLTDGYARALELEAERRRTEGRILELAGNGGPRGELRALTGRLEEIELSLRQLRGLLGTLAATL